MNSLNNNLEEDIPIGTETIEAQFPDQEADLALDPVLAPTRDPDQSLTIKEETDQPAEVEA